MRGREKKELKNADKISRGFRVLLTYAMIQKKIQNAKNINFSGRPQMKENKTLDNIGGKRAIKTPCELMILNFLISREFRLVNWIQSIDKKLLNDGE